MLIEPCITETILASHGCSRMSLMSDNATSQTWTDSEAVLKICSRHTAEAEALRLHAEFDWVPDLYSSGEEAGYHWMLMEFIEHDYTADALIDVTKLLPDFTEKLTSLWIPGECTSLRQASIDLEQLDYVLADSEIENLKQKLDFRSEGLMTHGDIHFGNVLVRKGRIVGIVDHEWSEYACKEREIGKRLWFFVEGTKYAPMTAGRLLPQVCGHLYRATSMNIEKVMGWSIVSDIQWAMMKQETGRISPDYVIVERLKDAANNYGQRVETVLRKLA